MPARPLRRSIAVSACLVSLLLSPQAAFGASSADRTPLGDAGAGPPTWVADRPLSLDPGVIWSDVDQSHWAWTAIDLVAAANRWMRDSRPQSDGTMAFRPDRLESRKLFARTLLRAFGSGSSPDPSLVFLDLPSTDRFYQAANVAVTAGWMTTDGAGAFRPAEPVTMREVHRALVLATGFGDLAAGVDAMHLQDGTPIPVPPDLGTTTIGMRIGLRYNHSDDSLDVGPDSPLSRAEVAWSLNRAATVPAWMHGYLSAYLNVELPALDPQMQQVLAFAVRYVGYPYVRGGEWPEPTSSGYCCGNQPVGGFDCSGLTWWLMKSAVEGWDPTAFRGYPGWDLAQRTSASMASVGARVTWEELVPGDLLFYDGDANGTVDHVNTYLGNGWAMDSSSGSGGVALVSVVGNWYQDHFVHGRRILT